jgi:DNA-directed RNA polymerase subunit RPC12/RpoP
VGRIRVCYGASIGAGAIVLPNVTIGRFAMVGAGALVTADVPDHGLVVGVPARRVGYVCACGRQLGENEQGSGGAEGPEGSKGAEGPEGAEGRRSRGDEETGGGGDGERVVLRCRECGREVEVQKADWEQVR